MGRTRIPGFTAHLSLFHKENRQDRLEPEFVHTTSDRLRFEPSPSQFEFVLARRRRDRPSTICVPPRRMCNGICVNPLTDNQNCGFCNEKCPYDAQCILGWCVCNDPNKQVCERRAVPPYETTISYCANIHDNDHHQCAACGIFCPNACVNGQCRACENDSQCPWELPVCDKYIMGRCTECSQNNMSKCDYPPENGCIAGWCGPCQNDSHCLLGEICVERQGVPECICPYGLRDRRTNRCVKTQCPEGSYRTFDGLECRYRCGQQSCNTLGPPEARWSCGYNGYFNPLNPLTPSTEYYCCRSDLSPSEDRIACCNPYVDRCDPTFCDYNPNECPSRV